MASLFVSQTSTVDLWMQNSVLRSRMTLVYWSQPSSVVLCIQKRDFSIRPTSLYLSQPSFVVFTSKTATFWHELRFSMGPSPHLCFLMQNSVFWTRITRGCEFQTSSMTFCIHNSDVSTRINSLYGSQTSPVVLCTQNNVISIGNTSLYGTQPSFAGFACKTATLGPELQVSMDPRPHLCFLHSKQRL